MNILLWIVAALGVVCIALAVLNIVALRMGRKRLKTIKGQHADNEMLHQAISEQALTITHLIEDLEGTRATIKARDIEMAGLYGEKTALQLEVERLHKPDLATLPLAEAVQPERPTRGRSKKGGAQ